MANDLSPDRSRAAQPTSAHRMIGMLNVSFAGVMLLCGACSGFYLLMQVTLAPFSGVYMQSMQEGLRAQGKQEHEKKIAALQAQEAAAATEPEKAQLAAERQALEQKGPVEIQIPDMMSLYRDPRLMGFLVADPLSGVLLNAFMLISGIGLFAAKNWARKLALWIAGFKIVRLVLLYGYAIVVVVPLFAAQLGEMMEKTVSSVPQRPGAPLPPQFGQTVAMFYGIALSASAVMMILGGAIYPIIVLWVLTRPKVKAACGEIPTGAPAGSP
jgi:hypothetical protein